MSKSRESWTIQDYMEEMTHLQEMDEMPWVDKRIEELKDEMKAKFSASELLANGFSVKDFSK
jgi:hypothetical protein